MTVLSNAKHILSKHEANAITPVKQQKQQKFVHCSSEGVVMQNALDLSNPSNHSWLQNMNHRWLPLFKRRSLRQNIDARQGQSNLRKRWTVLWAQRPLTSRCGINTESRTVVVGSKSERGIHVAPQISIASVQGLKSRRATRSRKTRCG